jgi:hypothetical protein
MFTVIELDYDRLAIAVNKGLLVDTATPFDIANVVGVLASQVAWVFGLYLPVRLLFLWVFSKARSWSSVRMSPSWAILADKTFSCLSNVSRS